MKIYTGMKFQEVARPARRVVVEYPDHLIIVRVSSTLTGTTWACQVDRITRRPIAERYPSWAGDEADAGAYEADNGDLCSLGAPVMLHAVSL
jgi:hypothetical protein